MRKREERLQNPRCTRTVGCPEEEVDSPHQRKAEHPGEQHRLPAGAATPRPDDKRKEVK